MDRMAFSDLAFNTTPASPSRAFGKPSKASASKLLFGRFSDMSNYGVYDSENRPASYQYQDGVSKLKQDLSVIDLPRFSMVDCIANFQAEVDAAHLAEGKLVCYVSP